MRFVERLTTGMMTLVLAASVLLGSQAQAGDDWSKSRKLNIDTSATGANIDAAVNQLPLLVRLHTGNFTFSEAKADGADLRFFAADNKTALKYHIERYDAANELAVVWVQVPSLAADSKGGSIWMRWGNPAAANIGDSKLIYDASQVFVLNFSDADGVKDATANGNHANFSSARINPLGPVGGAAAFDGTARVVLPSSSSLKLTNTGWTFSAWIKPAVVNGGLFALGSVGVDLSIGKLTARSGAKLAQSTVTLKPDTWQHIAVTVAEGKARFFVDGQPAGEGSLPSEEAGGDAIIGANFRGELDAVGLSQGARSPAYIKAAASSQLPDSPMVTFADDEEAGGVNYFAILIGAVTVDGWVVIGILGIMAVVSFYVMVTKTLKLATAEKANAAFLGVFKEKALDMLDPEHAVVRELEQTSAVQNSSLYQLYLIGLKEMAQRFGLQAKSGVERNLSSAALESIRAALDAAIVRSNQRFNSGIVLLTIAISGGPFLGLLGTVVGVMITFAAIAAAGDVNVNAIAPGIAAALVATVAGLAVAIPALFAYNWFAIRIKNIGADTQVFADEMLTKSAELYSR